MAFATRNCPAVPEHGSVLEPKDGKSLWYCPHQEHDGLRATHPRGPGPQTRAYFTKAEVESGVLASSHLKRPPAA